MAGKIVHLSLPKKDSDQSPRPIGAQDDFVEITELDDLRIPWPDFRLETSRLGNWDNRTLRCSCCKSPRPDIELEYTKYRNRYNTTIGALEQGYFSLRPPLVVHCCETCLKNAQSLIRNRLRERYRKAGSWTLVE